MSFINHFSNVSTNELVEQFKSATLQGKPPQELVEELAKRPGIAFIQATDSTEITLEKARAAIHQIERSTQ
ncbi:MAG TPA: hypothetical protein DEV81_06575 [Cyanobacteria bacterium UBA11049]|nr:hypothetical protein [Cyanobacteria bacterium UBA11049]